MFLTIGQASRVRVAAVSPFAPVAFESVARSAGETNICSHRQPVLIGPMLNEFTRDTGIRTNAVYATKGLAERIKAKGAKQSSVIHAVKNDGVDITELRKKAGESVDMVGYKNDPGS